jgi:hypothetical protein
MTYTWAKYIEQLANILASPIPDPSVLPHILNEIDLYSFTDWSKRSDTYTQLLAHSILVAFSMVIAVAGPCGCRVLNADLTAAKYDTALHSIVTTAQYTAPSCILSDPATVLRQYHKFCNKNIWGPRFLTE